jgi:outer membrane protein assembly factor BamB
MSTPAIDDEMVYVSAFDLEARDRATGDVQWTFETDVDAGALPAPTVANDLVFVPGSIKDPTLYPIDARTGAERWRASAAIDIKSTPAVVEEKLYVLDRSNTLFSLTAATGEAGWRIHLDGDFWHCSPAVVDQMIYLGSKDGDVLALHTEDGSEMWRRQLGFGIGGPLQLLM